MESPLKAGIMFLPTAGTYFFALIFASVLPLFRVHRNYILYTYLSLLASMSLAAGLMSRFDKSTSTSSLLGLQALFSASAAFGEVSFPLYQMSTNHWIAPPSRLLFLVVERVGGTAAISAAQTAFWTQLSRGVSRNAPDLQTILHCGARNFKHQLSGETLDAALDIFNDAFTKTFYVSAAAGALPFAVAILYIWFVKR